MNRIIGVDLGTTHSLAAYTDETGPQLIPNALGERLTPSVVGVDLDGRLVIGRAAKELQVLHPERCASLFKRHMGSDWTTELAGRTFTPEELSSLVLGSLKADAEAHFREPVERAVITVPAYFNDQQRKATITAGKLAGFEVDRIVNEPTAAALAYGYHESEEAKILFMFDLGGGTFDVSIVEIFDGVVEVRASSGEAILGGEDFTRVLAARLLERQGYVYERAELMHAVMVARTLQQAENAKCKLSREEAATIRIPRPDGALGDDSLAITVKREEFQAWTEGILSRIDLPVRRVLADTGLKIEEISQVLLVGGATRMPAVVKRVEHLFGKSPEQRINPDEVVALGAAVQAGLSGKNRVVKDLVVTDVCPFTLGVSCSKRVGTELRDGYFSPIINRNTVIPVSRVERFSTVHPNQTEVTIRIYQGESRRVDQNLLIGEFTVAGIPRATAGEQSIDIRFTYDLNGVLEAEATIVSTEKRSTHVVTRFARGMSPEQLARAVAEMKQLKAHPREETVNRFLMRRAERLYEELTAEGRVILSQLLDGFESALELRDAAAIESHRSALREFLDRWDGETERYGEGESYP